MSIRIISSSPKFTVDHIGAVQKAEGQGDHRRRGGAADYRRRGDSEGIPLDLARLDKEVKAHLTARQGG